MSSIFHVFYLPTWEKFAPPYSCLFSDWLWVLLVHCSIRHACNLKLSHVFIIYIKKCMRPREPGTELLINLPMGEGGIVSGTTRRAGRDPDPDHPDDRPPDQPFP